MARLLGFASVRPEPEVRRRFPAWGEGLRRACPTRGPATSGQWISPAGDAGVLYVETAAGPFRAAADPGGAGLTIVEGAVHRGKRLADAREVADHWTAKGERAFDDFEGGYCVIRLRSGGRGIEIARDRYGLKPLFYRQHRDIFFFSTSASLLAALATGRREPNRALLALYATSHYSTVYGRPPTFFRDVHQIAPATVLSWAGGAPAEKVYWRFDAAQSFLPETDEKALADELAARLEKTVEERLAPLPARRGFSLSGGMDSNTILGFAKKLAGEKQVAVSVTYHEDDRANEHSLIAPVAKTSLSVWHNIKPTPAEFRRDMETLYRFYDQPWTTATVYAHERLSRAAAEAGLACLVGGAGGDYHMAGNYPNFLYYFAHLRQKKDETLLRREVAKWIENHSTPQWPKSMATVERFFESSVDLRTPGVLRQGDVRLAPGRPLLTASAERLYALPAPVESYGDYLRSFMVQEIARDALPPPVWAEDVMAWRYGLASADPFWDRALFDFTWRLPHGLKIRDGVNKHLLRRATDGIVPDHLRLRKDKTGFSLPFDRWLEGDLGDFARDVLGSASFAARDIVDPGVARGLLEEHRAGRARHGMVIWQMLNMELWFREWIDPPEREVTLC